ncbi:hypothetical protein D9619_004181 [Psilocybe cf. subviscida]|uniref:Uncharacterized protein n=1 Tax=Psilocybe cf. subviscida TaxID=2480587 RepID=A0A8H5BPI8_9AGAR|nr:hypothetical protein D9619_004181 [Psilocybe cf. subviscida]
MGYRTPDLFFVIPSRASISTISQRFKHAPMRTFTSSSPAAHPCRHRFADIEGLHEGNQSYMLDAHSANSGLLYHPYLTAFRGLVEQNVKSNTQNIAESAVMQNQYAHVLATNGTSPTSPPEYLRALEHPSTCASKARTDNIHPHQRERHTPRERDRDLRAWVDARRRDGAGVRFGCDGGSAGEGCAAQPVSDGWGGVREENEYYCRL